MSHFLIILLCLLGPGSAPGPTFQEHINALRERFDVVFVYDADLDPGEEVLPGELKSDSLEGCLDELLSNADIAYMVRGRTVVLFRFYKRDTLHIYHSAIRPAMIRAERVFRDTPGAVPIEPMPRMPQLLGESDPLKLALLSPGIVPAAEGSASIIVRGGEPDGNLILLDGVPFYNSSHLMGYLSVFDDDAISKIRLYKGHFPTRYEGRASSVIDAEGRDGADDRLRGSIGVGILTDKLLLEGPVGKNTTFLISGRFFGLGILKSVFKVFEKYGDYTFYDVYGRVTHTFSERDRLRLTVFRGHDHMRDTLVSGQWGTTLASAAWNHRFSSSTEATTTLSYQHYCSSDDNFSSSIQDWRAAFDASSHMENSHTLRWGGGYSYRYLTPTTTITSHHPVHDFSAYGEDEWRKGCWTAVAGIHINLYAVPGNAYFTAQPRLFLQYAPDRWRLFGSAGRMVQPIHALTSSQTVTLPSDLLVCVSGNVRPMTSDQISFGAEYNGWATVTAEAWVKRMEGVLEYKDDRLGHVVSGYWQNNVVSGEGRAAGLEIAVSKQPWFQLSYTLSKSMRRFDQIDGGAWFPSSNEHRHSIVTTMKQDITKHLEIRELWTWISGGYITVPERYSFVMTPSGQFKQRPVYEGRNNYQLPASHRLDISASVHFNGNHYQHRLTAGVYNVYAANNPSFATLWYKQNPNPSAPDLLSVAVISVFRVLPSLSYSVRF